MDTRSYQLNKMMRYKQLRFDGRFKLETQMKNALSMIVLACCLVTGGCASITRGTTDALVITSEPSGASVRLSNGNSGVTPATFVLPRKHNTVVTIKKEGYEEVVVNVVSQVDAAGGAGMAGNVLLGGIIGAAVDASTGAMKSLKPNPVAVTLVKKQEENFTPDKVVP